MKMNIYQDVLDIAKIVLSDKFINIKFPQLKKQEYFKQITRLLHYYP